MQTRSFESMQNNIFGKACKQQRITNIFHYWESMQTTSFSIYFLYVIIFISNIFSKARNTKQNLPTGLMSGLSLAVAFC